jgi:very-short-patch-repair endonuclease
MDHDRLHRGASGKLFEFARANRKAMTEAEKVLWEALRGRRWKGHKFRRQHPIGNFIADFFCFEADLMVEVDGEYHLNEDQQIYDENRTFVLTEEGLTVIRFTNKEVMEKLDFVLHEIETQLNKTSVKSSPGGEDLVAVKE